MGWLASSRVRRKAKRLSLVECCVSRAELAEGVFSLCEVMLTVLLLLLQSKANKISWPVGPMTMNEIGRAHV